MDRVCSDWEQVKKAIRAGLIWAAKCLYQWLILTKGNEEAKKEWQKLLQERKELEIITDVTFRLCYEERLKQLKNMGATREEAKDIALESLLRTYLNIRDLSKGPIKNPCAYSHTIARNLYINKQDNTDDLNEAIIGDLVEGSDHWDDRDFSAFKKYALKCVNELNPINKWILILHILKGLTFGDIASMSLEEFGKIIKEGALRKRYNDVRRRIAYSCNEWECLREIRQNEEGIKDEEKLKIIFKDNLKKLNPLDRDVITWKFKNYSTDQIIKKVNDTYKKIFNQSQVIEIYNSVLAELEKTIIEDYQNDKK